jgi:hypothetical protein
MANEAVKIVDNKNTITRQCYDAVAIPKGTILRISGTNFVYPSVATDTGVPYGGIAIEEKTASDGVVTIGVAFNDGVFDLKNSSTITSAVGTKIVMSGANMYRAAVAGDLLTGSVIGTLEEVGTSTGVDRVRLSN